MENQKALIELAHKYKMEEIAAELKAKLEVERLHHENDLGAIRFK